MKPTKKINIVFVLPSLVPGGAERIISFVSQNLNPERFNSQLLIAGFEKDSAYDIKGIKVTYLNKTRVLHAIPGMLFFLLKAKPAIVVSSIAHLNAAMAIISPFFRKTKFVGREATVLSFRKGEKKKKRRLYPSSLIKNSYKKLDALICQSGDMAKDMAENYEVSPNKIRIINNPISNLPPLKEKSTSLNVKRFITVGRLTEVKGHFRILSILSKLRVPFTYTIIGDGDLKNDIFIKAQSLGIFDKINHIPFTKEVNKYLAENDLFLQGSYVEGFPNALLESCVVGTPVIAFDVPGGTKEIVEHNINGYLVKDEASYLTNLKEDKEWDPKQIRDSVYKKFNEERIIGEYQQLFEDLIYKQ
ncbi:glycosyltransferase [Ascidiimonas sp. W6]|uniref:glycosyltransferase n=1 Tax=Ascidiimonas meishanensis TaxID=3128903 RepID=UPI0030EE7F54